MPDQSPTQNSNDRGPAPVPRHPNRRLPPWRLISATECDALLTACAADPDPDRGARDAAIIAVLAATGLRAGEVTELKLGDWNPNSATIRVHGRMGHDRTVHLPPVAAAHLHAWLARRGARAGTLFPPRGRTELGQLCREQLGRLLRARARQAGVPQLRAHDLRATLGIWLYAQNPPSLAPQILGVQLPPTPRGQATTE